MLDFYTIEKKYSKVDGCWTVYPEFRVGCSPEDLMVRGHSFYGVWDEEKGFWSQNEYDIQRFVDNDIFEAMNKIEVPSQAKLMRNFSSNKWAEWQKYCKSLPDSYQELDKTMIFSNQDVKKEDYVTKKLKFPLIEQQTPAYDEMMSILYSSENLEKLEWAIGAIITGDSKWIQKFIVLYGPPGSGKSTFMNLMQSMFPGYYCLFNAKNLTGNKDFALESMKSNPLFAIQHDGDLSRIEDNTILNSIVSHEEIEVNEKFKSKYTMRFETFLFMGTNKPVKITDSKSGILRRLIDVYPTGNKIQRDRFDILWKNMKFEFSGIAWKCLETYKKLGPNYYDEYVPITMIGETNDIYNFIEDNYELFQEEKGYGIPLSVMWKRYKEYCEEARIAYPLSMRVFKTEMKEYFNGYSERVGSSYSVYRNFKREKFEKVFDQETVSSNPEDSWLKFDSRISLLDDICKDCLAQGVKKDGTPLKAWDHVKTTLSELDTTKLHYVRVPEKLIVIDFDLKGENGEKDYRKNLEEASKWPPTYAELSKSGSGIHLHYIYDGDPTDLSRIFADDIEIKVFSGNSSLRRCVTLCNNISLVHISSGLPLRERKKSVIKEETIRSEKSLRRLIERNMRKEIHAGTKPSIDFIYKILEDAYASGLNYDITDMNCAIQTFAMNSTHQADYCIKMVNKMKFKSEEPSNNIENYKDDTPIVIFDVEVFPNLFVVCLKRKGEGNPVIKMINPRSAEVEGLFSFKLVGFNNRRYDNHILYARSMGYTNDQLFKLSQRIIDGDKDALFGEAYNISYTDIYDFLSAENKMGLKKWEIKLGIHHQECGLPWNQPVSEDLWPKVADYCGNDVLATEAVWDANPDDWLARQILAEWAEMTVNDTTNSLTTKIIIGDDKDPWSKYIYTDLSTIFPGYEFNPFGIDKNRYNDGAKIVQGKSIYKGKDPGEGGYAVGYPGIYYEVAVLDVSSMHPHSAIRLKIFGEEYTMKFADIVEARVCIKNKDYEGAKQYLPEKLHGYLTNKSEAKKLAKALKTAINSVYGLTSASFKHKLRDPRNVDNIVAKYGALFMINLEEEVRRRGYTVVHIKTDSIKIANADDEIIQFVIDYGKKYGFTFVHEDTYEKICIVNDAVYIAKYKQPHKDEKTGENVWWTATGTQFQIPYVFKTLFSKESITFKDMCQTFSVSTALYLDMNEHLNDLPFDDQGFGTPIGPDGLPVDAHDYRFVGKIGEFVPVKEGAGGGILLRELGDAQQESTGKRFAAATGTKKTGTKNEVYRWMESEMVKILKLEDHIDRNYWNHLVDEAVDTINKYGDFEAFVSDDKDTSWLNVPDSDMDEIPFEECMNFPRVA